ELLTGGHRPHPALIPAVGDTGRRRGQGTPHLHLAFVDEDIDVPVRMQPYLELRTDVADQRVTHVHEEWPRGIVDDVEMRLASSKIHITPLRSEAHREHRVGVECELRPVCQAHATVLTDGSGEELHARPTRHPEPCAERDDEHGRRRRFPVLFASAEEPAALRAHESGELVIRQPVRQAVEEAPRLAQLFERAAIAGIFAQPRVELASLGDRQPTGVETPGPNRRLVVDLRLGLQSDDVAHLDSPSFTRRRGNGSPGTRSNPSSNPRLRNRSRQRTSPLATCFSIVLCERPSTCAISACESWYTLRSTKTRRQSGGRLSTAAQNDSNRRRRSTCSSGSASSEETFSGSKSATSSVACVIFFRTRSTARLRAMRKSKARGESTTCPGGSAHMRT